MSQRICSVPGCERPHDARGYCHGHYRRWQHHGDPNVFDPLIDRSDPAARFWAKVEKTETCWRWTGTTGRGGHGMFRLVSSRLAHRVAYEMLIGPIPPGRFVLHKCGVPSCVRPEHLYLGSQLQNMRDRDRHGRTARGNRSGRAKLTYAVAEEIRRRYREEDVSIRALATQYSVGHTTLRSVVRNYTYTEPDAITK